MIDWLRQFSPRLRFGGYRTISNTSCECCARLGVPDMSVIIDRASSSVDVEFCPAVRANHRRFLFGFELIPVIFRNVRTNHRREILGALREISKCEIQK